MVDILGCGALNLDVMYAVSDLAAVRAAGFPMFPGREIAGDHASAADLLRFLEGHGRLMARSGGGSSANTVCALGRIGWRTSFSGVVGDDEEGDFILDSMRGVDCSLVRRNGRSALCVVAVEEGRRDRAMFVAPHDRKLDLVTPEVLETLAGSRCLHLSSLVQQGGIAAQARLAEALEPSQVLSFDPGELYAARGLDALGALLQRTDLLFATEEEITLLTGGSLFMGVSEVLARLRLRGGVGGGSGHSPLFMQSMGPVLVCKEGAEGATLCASRHSCCVPAVRVPEIVDNTGAGDAFDAGFLDGLFRGFDAEGCLVRATRIAALSLSAFGRLWLESLSLPGCGEKWFPPPRDAAGKR